MKTMAKIAMLAFVTMMALQACNTIAATFGRNGGSVVEVDRSVINTVTGDNNTTTVTVIDGDRNNVQTAVSPAPPAHPIKGPGPTILLGLLLIAALFTLFQVHKLSKF